jgi:hypothetical protein
MPARPAVAVVLARHTGSLPGVDSFCGSHIIPRDLRLALRPAVALVAAPDYLHQLASPLFHAWGIFLGWTVAAAERSKYWTVISLRTVVHP